jgi:hypothetical protein
MKMTFFAVFRMLTGRWLTITPAGAGFPIIQEAVTPAPKI